jgi:tripartite-type tricarboxylate transporter receptor subunit TctC
MAEYVDLTAPFLFLAKKALPADDLKGLMAWPKSNPYKASFGTGGTTGLDHIAAVLFQEKIRTPFGFVPYRGGAPALQDLVAGHDFRQLIVTSRRRQLFSAASASSASRSLTRL